MALLEKIAALVFFLALKWYIKMNGKKKKKNGDSPVNEVTSPKIFAH